MMSSEARAPVRRPVIAAAILLVALAVTLVAIRSWLDQPRVEEIDEPAIVAVEPDPIGPLPEHEPEPVVAPAVAIPDAEVETQAPPAVTPEPITVIVLPARSADRDPAAEAFLFNVRAAMLRELPVFRIEAIDVSAAELAAFVPPGAGTLGEDRHVYLALAHRYGGLNVAEIVAESSPDSSSWSIRLSVFRNAGSSSSGTSVQKYGDPRPENAPEAIGIRFAETLTRNVTRESFATAGASSATLILADPTRSDQERLRALNQIQRGGFDSTTMAAAINFATQSPSAGTRRAVWTALRRNIYDPMLAQPFSNALLYDADVGVRTEAALALQAYPRDPIALSALERARLNDSSPEVKLAAHMSMLDFEERQAFARETLLNRNLSPAERLAPSRLGGSIFETPSVSLFDAVAAEDALAYTEILAGTDDPELTLQALNALQVASIGSRLRYPPERRVDQAITEALIESSTHADDRVRRQALGTLTSRYTSVRTDPTQPADPEDLRVRAALEIALREHPELAAELRIEDALRERENSAPPGSLPPLSTGRAPR